ncbi:MAG: DUF3574 domain-containing protein [Alphaproteobacteria bacterium]|nr:DUF3574 domain-containing protein [Alphaproteobacteria bacterium]
MRSAALLAAASLTLGACAPPGGPAACTPPLEPAVEIDLYFGRDKPAGGEVSEAEWQAFLAEIVTPRFPDGLSVIDVAGQYRESTGRIVRERSKRLVIVSFDAPAHRIRVDEITAAYKQRHGQQSVLRVERPVCAGF